MANSSDDTDPKARVFISYSRRDLAFAEALRANLIDAGFDAYLDKHDIAPGEPWRERLGGLIESAAKVVFLISPESASSEICAWEVDHAESLGKTILPVVARETPPAEVPERLQRLNFIFMRDAQERAAATPQLVKALEIDLAWEREKTRIGDLALNWERSGRAAHLLLSGDATIRVAEDWRDAHPATSPPPTGLHLEFIARSRERQIRRRRYMIGGGIAIAVALVIAGLVALDQQRRAAEARMEQFRAESSRLAGSAEQAIARGDPATAMLLALAGLPDETRPPADGGPLRPLVPEARRVLQTALWLNREEAMIRVGRRAVYDADFSPSDPVLIVVASEDRAEVWNVETRRRLATLTGHRRPVTSVDFSPDGQRIVTGSEDGSARVWRAGTGEEIARLEGAASNVLRAAFSPDGARVVAVAELEAPAVQIWSAAGGPPLATLAIAARSAEFGGDGRSLLIAGADGTFWIEDAFAAPDARRRIGAASAEFATLGPDSARAAIVESNANTVRLVEMARPGDSRLLTGHSDIVFRAAFSPDGARIATASADGTARIWDAATGAEIARLTVPGMLINAAAFSADGGRIVTAVSDGSARLWRAGDDKAEVARLSGLLGRAADLAFLADGGWRVAGLVGEEVRIWTGTAGAGASVAAGAGARHVDLSADGARLAAVFADGAVRAWDAAGAAVAGDFRIEGEPLVVALSGDGAILAAASDREARAWRIADAALLSRLDAGAVSLAFSRRGDRLFAALTDGTTREWGLGDVEGRGPPPCPPTIAAHLVVASAATDHLACASGGRAWIASVGAGAAAPVPIAGHLDTIEHAAFSADGARLATISRGPVAGPDGGDAPLRIWDVRTGAELARFSNLLANPGDGLARAAFAPAGDAVATLSLMGALGRVRAYGAAQEIVDAAKRAVPRCLTDDQLKAAELSAEGQAWCRARFSAEGE